MKKFIRSARSDYMKNRFLKFVLFSIVCSVLLLISCDKTKTDATPPIFSVPFVDPDKVVSFVGFGSDFHDGTFCPNYEVTVNGLDVEVFSASAGTIKRIDSNREKDPHNPAQDDFEIGVVPFKNSRYMIIYDHVKNLPPNIVVGAKLQPGDLLGNVGYWSMGIGRTEFQVNKYSDYRHRGAELSICPEKFGTEAFNDAMRVAHAKGPISPYVCMRETAIP